MREQVEIERFHAITRKNRYKFVIYYSIDLDFVALDLQVMNYY